MSKEQPLFKTKSDPAKWYILHIPSPKSYINIYLFTYLNDH